MLAEEEKSLSMSARVSLDWTRKYVQIRNVPTTSSMSGGNPGEGKKTIAWNSTNVQCQHV